MEQISDLKGDMRIDSRGGDRGYGGHGNKKEIN